MGNQQGKKHVKNESVTEDKDKDGSSESFEEGTCVDSDMIPLIVKPPLENVTSTVVDTNEDENSNNTFMSGLPGERMCEDIASDNTKPNGADLDHHKKSNDVEKESKSHELSPASSDEIVKQKRELVKNEKSQVCSRNEVLHEQVTANKNNFPGETETVNEVPLSVNQSGLTECCAISHIDGPAINMNRTDTFSEEKIRVDTNSNFQVHYGSLCYDATGQFKKRITSDEVDNRSTYVETDLCNNCDSVRPKMYSNVIFLPDKSKGASPKRYGPKRLGSKYDGMKVEDSDSESDIDDKLKDGYGKNDCSREISRHETLSEVCDNPATKFNVHKERNEDCAADMRNESLKDKNGADEAQAENVDLQFSEDHFGLYTGCEASGSSQVNSNEPVVNVPNEQAQSGSFSVKEVLEIDSETTNRSPERNPSQLPVSRNEKYPEVKNGIQHGKILTTEDIKAQTGTPDVQNLAERIPDNEPIEACAICKKLRDECLCLFPKPVFSVMTVSCYECSKPILSYFRYLKLGEKSVDWPNLKSAQAKFAMGLKSLKTSLPDDNRMMFEFNLPSNKGFKHQSKKSVDSELRVTLEKNLAFNEDEELIEFLESRVNLKRVSMSDSFNSNKYVMINDFDDNSDDEMLSDEENDSIVNSIMDRTEVDDVSFNEKSDQTSENNVVFDNVLNDGNNPSPDNVNCVTEEGNLLDERNLELVGLTNNHVIDFADRCSLCESMTDNLGPSLCDSAESHVEESERVTENTADNLLNHDNAIEDEPIIANDIGLPSENGAENNESLNAAVSDNEAQMFSENHPNTRSGIVHENSTGNTVFQSLKSFKTKLEDDNRLHKLPDDNDNVLECNSGINREMVVASNHSSDLLQTPQARTEPEIEDYVNALYDRQLQKYRSRHTDQMRGLGGIEQSIGRLRRDPQRLSTANSTFAESFYESDAHRMHIPQLGNQNKNLREPWDIDQLHERRRRFLESSGLRLPDYDHFQGLFDIRRSSSDSSSPSSPRSASPESPIMSRSSSPDEIWSKRFKVEQNICMQARKTSPKCRFTVLCVDISESMKGSPWQHVKDFVPNFLSGLEKIRHDHGIQERVALVTFGHETKIACYLTDNYQEILNTLDTLRPDGFSPMLMGLMLAFVCIGLCNGDFCKLRLHDIEVFHRIILLTDGYPSPSTWLTDPEDIPECLTDPEDIPECLTDPEDIPKCLTDSEVIPESKRQEAITEIREFFEDDDVEVLINCILLGDNANTCFRELSNGRLFAQVEIEQLIRSTHNHYICAQISNHMFKVPNVEGLDVDKFASLVRELYPNTSQTDLSEMEKLAHDACTRLAVEKSRSSDDRDPDGDDVNDHFEPQHLKNLPSIGSRVTVGPDLSNEDELFDIGIVTGHSHKKEGKVFVQWDCGSEKLCCYGYKDKWEIVPNETKETFSVDDIMKPGNKVRRGPDWSYGNDDGGSDQVGAVYNVCPDGVVWVRWPNGNHGNYRYNQDGMFDVLKSDPVDPTGEDLFVALMNQRNKDQGEE